MATSTHPDAEFSLPLQWIDFDEIGLTRDRLVELIEILQATLREHDRLLGPSS
jgi:hypothetical protein